MATDYPDALDVFTAVAGGQQGTPSADGRVHSARHNDVEDAVEALEAELGVNPSGAATTVAARLAPIERLASALPPCVLQGIATTTVASSPAPVAFFGGYLWGAQGTTISRSSDEGATWSTYCTGAPSGTIIDMRLAFDGEVVLITGNQIHRSTGWAGGSPTWTLKATANGTCQFQPWSLNGDGTKFITTEYSSTRPDSRYGRISLDGGVTWAVKYDSVAIGGATLANSSHLHGCEYDPWADRFYISEGHDDGGSVGDFAGLYYSDDDGATWQRAAGMKQNPSPTVVVATDEGLVCAADSSLPGLWGVVRCTDGTKEVLTQTYRWGTGRDGTIGFGVQGARDPLTGVVYVGFRAAVASAIPVIIGGTPTTASLVHRSSASSVGVADAFYGVWVTGTRRLTALSLINGTTTISRGAIPDPAATNMADTSSVLGGAGTGSSLAVGATATTGATIRATAVGQLASAGSSTQDATAVGYSASTTGASGTAVGASAVAQVTGVAVGYNANTGAFAQNTVVGAAASGTSSAATAVGNGASAGNAGVAVGVNAAAATGVAVGYGAIGYTSGVAVGYQATVGTNVQGTAVGAAAAVSSSAGTAIGQAATAGNAGTAVGSGAVGGTTGAALGYQATVSNKSYAVAVGCQASANGGNYSVALGASVTTTDTYQVAVGARHFEIAEMTAPAAPGADKARLYVEDNGSGKTRLVVKFPTGAAQVLATEP